MEVSTEKGKTMTNSTDDNSAYIRMNGKKLDQFQVFGSNSVQGRHPLSNTPLLDRLSIGSYGQIKKDLAKAKPSALHASSSCTSLCSNHFHPPLRL